MSKQQEALRLAQEALMEATKIHASSCKCSVCRAVIITREALAEQPAQQQEPVAWATQMGEYAHIHWGAKRPEYPMVYEFPLYTSPQSKPWVGLTDEERHACTQSPFSADNYRAIEAKLKDKNT